MKKHVFNKPARTLAIAAGLLAVVPMTAQACGDSPYLATICTFAMNYCPNGFLPADGRQMSISANTALYALLGIRFGGDGATYFNLPDLRGRTVVGTGTGANPTLTPVVLGAKTGAETVTLSAAQTPLPAHTHTAALQNANAAGSPSLPVTGTSTGSVTGTITVNALTTATTGAVNVPTTSNNTVGKAGTSQMFYPYDASKALAVPASTSGLSSSGTVSGTASGNVTLPVTGAVAVAANTPTSAQPVSLVNPRLGLTVCIVTSNALYPPQPQ